MEREVEARSWSSAILGHWPFGLIADISGQRRCNFRPGDGGEAAAESGWNKPPENPS